MSGQYESLATKHLNVTIRSGDEWMVRCVFHDDSNASMQFNVAKGLFICFSCGARGNAKKLQKQLGIRWSEGEIDVADIRAKLDILRDPTYGQAKILDESYLDRYKFPTDYWADRGFDDASIEAFDLGYDPLGGYVTIPVRDVRGNLLGVIRRFLDPDAELRYRYPKGFKRSTNLFASWMVEHDEETDHVVLVEGSLDAIKVWQAGYSAVACFGNSISATQIRVLRRLGVSQVTLFSDNDRGGRDLTDCALGWHNHKDRYGNVRSREYRRETDLSRDFLVRKVDWKGVRAKDPGAMNSQQIEEMLRKARRLF